MQLPASVSIEKHNENTVLVIDNELASAKISLFGAHVFSLDRKSTRRLNSSHIGASRMPSSA